MLNGFWGTLNGLYGMRNYRPYEWLNRNAKADADTNKHANNVSFRFLDHNLCVQQLVQGVANFKS